MSTVIDLKCLRSQKKYYKKGDCNQAYDDEYALSDLLGQCVNPCFSFGLVSFAHRYVSRSASDYSNAMPRGHRILNERLVSSMNVSFWQIERRKHGRPESAPCHLAHVPADVFFLGARQGCAAEDRRGIDASRNVNITLNVYTQVLDDSVRHAANRIGEELFSIVQFSEGEKELIR